MLMGVSTLACTCIGMRIYDVHAWVSACLFEDTVFSGPRNTDLLTEVRVFCVPICDYLYIPNRYCGQMPEKTIIHASAHSKNSCARHVLGRKL